MDNLPRNKEKHGNSHFDSFSFMSGLPLHLIDEILFRLEPNSLAMMRCTNKSIKSYLTDPIFGPEYPSWVRSSLFHLCNYNNNYVFCLPLDYSSDSGSLGKKADMVEETCYMFGSCSGLILLYIGCLFVANPITKRFRILDHSGSKLIPIIVGRYASMERAMCVGFAVDQNRTSKRFKIVCILEMETMYGFEINDGDLWRVSETTITASTKSDLTSGMKPVYLENTLHWLRNDGSIIAFNPETEEARFIPSIFHREPDMNLLFAKADKIDRLTLISGTTETITVYTLLGNHKWEPATRIKNLFTEANYLWWNIVGYDGKCLLVTLVKEGVCSFECVVHGYDMEAKSWGVLGSTPRYTCYDREFYKFTPSLFFVEEDEQQKLIVESSDQRISNLNAVMGLIDTTK